MGVLMAKERTKKGKKEGAEVQEEQNIAIVLKVYGRTGVHGEVNHVLCKLISGKDKGKTLKRNVKGPVKVNDKIVLLETEREAKAISSKRR